MTLVINFTLIPVNSLPIIRLIGDNAAAVYRDKKQGSATYDYDGSDGAINWRYPPDATTKDGTPAWQVTADFTAVGVYIFE